MSQAEVVKLGLVVAVLVLVAVGRRLLIRADQRDHGACRDYHLIDLLLGKDGRASKSAHAYWTCLIASTAVVLYLALRNNLDPTIFIGYLAAWVAPQINGQVQDMMAKRAATNTPDPLLPKTPKKAPPDVGD